MMRNASLFSQYRLDDIIVSYIEMDSVKRTSQLLILLAQEVLLNWILSQSAPLFDEMQSISLIRALEVWIIQYRVNTRFIIAGATFLCNMNHFAFCRAMIAKSKNWIPSIREAEAEKLNMVHSLRLATL